MQCRSVTPGVLVGCNRIACVCTEINDLGLFLGWQKHVTCLLTRRGVALYISLSTGIVAGFLFSLCTFNLFIFSCRRILFDYYRSAIYSSALRNKVCKVFFFFFFFSFFFSLQRSVLVGMIHF